MSGGLFVSGGFLQADSIKKAIYNLFDQDFYLEI